MQAAAGAVSGCCLRRSWGASALRLSLVGVCFRSRGAEVVPLSSSAAAPARPLRVRVRSRRGLLSAGRAKCSRMTLVIR